MNTTPPAITWTITASRVGDDVFNSAERHIVAIHDGSRARKICLIQFAKTGILVHLPYHPSCAGAMKRISLDQPTITTVLGEETALTGHRVKYSHHFDGAAHFSQDGLINTTIRTHAFPLFTPARHLFSIDAFGLETFSPVEPHERYPVTTLDLPPSEFGNVAHLMAQLFLLPEGPAGARNPLVWNDLMAGRVVRGQGVLPPARYPHYRNLILGLFCYRRQLHLPEPPRFLFVFSGGFYSSLTLTTGLLLIYPSTYVRESDFIDRIPPPPLDVDLHCRR